MSHDEDDVREYVSGTAYGHTAPAICDNCGAEVDVRSAAKNRRERDLQVQVGVRAWYTLREVSAILGYHHRTVRIFVRDGDLATYRDEDGNLWISFHDVLAFSRAKGVDPERVRHHLEVDPQHSLV